MNIIKKCTYITMMMQLGHLLRLWRGSLLFRGLLVLLLWAFSRDFSNRTILNIFELHLLRRTLDSYCLRVGVGSAIQNLANMWFLIWEIFNEIDMRFRNQINNPPETLAWHNLLNMYIQTLPLSNRISAEFKFNSATKINRLKNPADQGDRTFITYLKGPQIRNKNSPSFRREKGEQAMNII